MIWARIVFVATLFVASAVFGQGTNPPTASATAAPAVLGRGSFPVRVLKGLDSSKLKQGDSIEVETAGSFKLADGTLVPKGSTLMGHVVASKARSNGDAESQLAITFDKLNLPARQPSVKGAVQAVFPPIEEAAPNMAGKATGAGGGGTDGIGIGTVTNNRVGSNLESDQSSQPNMNMNSAGVHGIRGLELKDGVLTTDGKNVKLGGGVRMVIRVDILG